LLCLAGSLRSSSYCMATCQAIREMAEATEFSVEIADPRELDLPMYEPDFGLADYAPKHAGIERLVESYRNADAMIWVSPTYHGTVSGVFKNMLDFAEFLSGDQRPYFQGRPVGLIAINDSTTFAAMRDCARELRAWLAPSHIELGESDFSSDLALASDKARNRVIRLIGELKSFVQAHRPA
ncbi:MAG: NAD(P)H-dependent oxidoreductase, partial [Fimbriimonas sp.]|nr:NAD(P)H-dependent oxidoreductase [Fimbriimonas sp.]